MIATRLPLAIGAWPSNFCALPADLAATIRQSYPADRFGAIALRLQWTGPALDSPALGTREAYVGWKDLTSRGLFLHVSREFAEHAGLARALALRNALSVNVYVVRDAPVAPTLAVEPATTEDWEQLERKAGHVEEVMLSQIAVVMPGQAFALWLAPEGPVVHLRVTEPMLSACVRLAQDSRIVVTPKPRAIEPEDAALEKSVMLRMCPRPGDCGGAAWVHSQTLAAMLAAGRWNAAADIVVSFKPTPGDDAVVAYAALRVDDSVAPNHIALSDVYNVEPFSKVVLRRCTAVAPAPPRTAELLGSPPAVVGLDDMPSPFPASLALSHGARLRLQSGVVCTVACPALPSSPWLGAPKQWTFGVADKPVAPALDLLPPKRILGGVDATLHALQTRFAPLLSRSGALARARLGAPPSAGAYVFAGRGAGKSSVADALCRALADDQDALVWSTVVDCQALKGGKRSEVQAKVDEAVAKAEARSPSLLVFDDLDALIPSESSDEQALWLRDYLVAKLKASTAKLEALHARFEAAVRAGEADRDRFAWNLGAVGWLATGRSKQSIQRAVLQCGALEFCLELPPLNAARRLLVLEKVAERMRVSIEGDLDGLACESFAPADMVNLLDRARIEAASARRAADTVTREDIDAAMDGLVAGSLRGAKLVKSTVQWSDVGGLDEVRSTLKDTLELPLQFAALYERSPQRLASGILLYGPPGCGKTLLAQAVAKECGLNFISVKGPEVLSKYIGASEQAVRDLFARGAEAAPSIIFFDEFDAVAPRRGADSSGVTDRVVNQLLTFLDGVESRSGVYVMAASSRPDLVDPALLRPGRLDKQLYCGFPSARERAAILHVVAAKMTLDEGVEQSLDALAESLSLFTGADLQALLYSAQLAAVHRADGGVVTAADLETALAQTRPSVSREERARYEHIYAEFAGNRDADFRVTDVTKPRTALM